MYRIHSDLIFRSREGGIRIHALVDTGATISVMPNRIARLIIFNRTPYVISLRGFMNSIQTTNSPMIVAETYLPAIRRKGRFVYAMVRDVDEVIIGMNILSLTGIYIHPRTRLLSVRNETWEAFKTLSGIAALGGIGYLLYKGTKNTK